MTPQEALAKAAESLNQATAAVLDDSACKGHVAIADRWIAIAGTEISLRFDPMNAQNYPVPGQMDRLEDGR